MKKLLLTAFLVIVLIITLASCSDKGDENVTTASGPAATVAGEADTTEAASSTTSEEATAVAETTAAEETTEKVTTVAETTAEETTEEVTTEKEETTIDPEYYSPGLKFTINDSGNGYSVSEGSCTETEIIIPSIYMGKPVTEIGTKAFCANVFYNCSSLTSITIPDSVTSIGDYAFWLCSSLTSITIPDSVTSIGRWAFDGTAFSHNSSNWTDGVLYIGKCLIAANDDISKAYTVKDGTVCIAADAFSSNYSLRSISIPDSVTSIGYGAFSGCRSLERIIVDDKNTEYHSAGNCLIETESKTLIAVCKNSVIPTDGSVTSIGGYAFSGCSNLTSITIPDSVTSIGNYAFYWCKSFKSITIPDSVTSIGYGAFGDCSSLTSISYKGTMAEWYEISKGADWDYNTGEYIVHCTDVDIAK